MFYEIDASHNVVEFINIGNSLNEIASSCRKSDFEALNMEFDSIEVLEDSGEIWQDFIYEHGIPIVSDKLKNFFEEQCIDYLFYKKILLKKNEIEKTYWIALPPRIDCLDKSRTEIDDIMNSADFITIDSGKIENFKIFKLKGITNTNIIITEEFAHALTEQKFIGLHIFELNN